MKVSKLHYISQGATPKAHLENIQNACAAGAELVQLRLKKHKANILLDIATKAREITAHYQTRLIINDHYKIAKQVGADGVHLGKSDACPLEARKHLDQWQLIGGTANTVDDCKVLLEKKVDYIGLGPYRFTKTKDKLSPIVGYEGYLDILKKLNTQTPIIAIGGVTLNDVSEILETGVYGVAVSGAITNDFNLISAFHTILQTASSQEQVWKAPNKDEI